MDITPLMTEIFTATKDALKSEWDEISAEDKALIQRIGADYAKLKLQQAKGLPVADELAIVEASIMNLKAVASIKAATIAKAAIDAVIGVAARVLKIAL
jgi:hypothetical protein